MLAMRRQGAALCTHLISLHVADYHDLRLGAEVQGQFRRRICAAGLAAMANFAFYALDFLYHHIIHVYSYTSTQ